MDEHYRTLAGNGGCEIIEKKSRFLGFCGPVKTEEDAIAFLEDIRAQHPAASHHVYAYRLRDNNLMRYSDDGEPQGTAGLPVLDVLRRRDLVDAVLVVTRYFGGTLLGTGGLVHAYGETANGAVQDAGVATMALCGVYALRCEYAHFDELQKLLERLEAKVLAKRFDTGVSLEIALLAERAPQLDEALAALTRGGPKPEHLYDKYACVDVPQNN